MSTTTLERPSNITTTLLATQPGQLRVIKRDGTVVPFEKSKITVAITKAFLAVEGAQAANSSRIHEWAEKLTDSVYQSFNRRWTGGGTIHIEAIQDRVELTLMKLGDELKIHNAYEVMRAFIKYRDEQARKREEAKQHETQQQAGTAAARAAELKVTLDDGKTVGLSTLQLDKLVHFACQGLSDVNPQWILDDIERNLFEGVAVSDVYKTLVLTARTLIEKEPNYTYVAARLLLNISTDEALAFLGLPNASLLNIDQHYPACLKAFIKKGIELKRLDPALAEFDLDKLGKALVSQRNQQFTYLGLQTLYDRYFLHHNGTRFELPQLFFMRVAMGLALQEREGTREDHAIAFYNLLSSFDYMSSTPTLFNSGTLHPQLSSCFLSTIPDDLDGILNMLRKNGQLSKWAGGLGLDWSNVRAMGSYIQGTNGQSSGVIPFLFLANALILAVNQGGKRKGAMCSYLETWHKDIEEFLELRKNTGDERRRTHDMNTANWIPDLFMKRVQEDGDWTLFSPNEVPDLHDLHGQAFEKAYLAYEKKAQEGLIDTKTIKAKVLWRKMLSMLFETGHPWITFKDPCNTRSPQQHAGVIHSSNLCTEITLNTSSGEDSGEVAVCNLGSVNLANHVTKDGLDQEKLRRNVKVMIRALDNVIEYNYYAVPEAERANLKHRPIGLGIMGFQDALYLQSIAYDSPEAVEFADRCMEAISYYAIEASMELAKERGTYKSYEGSLWSKGILPIDSIQLLEEARGKNYLDIDRSTTMDWDTLRANVKQHKIHNSNILAIAPTATISNICGVTQSIEPTYRNLFVKSNLSGEFTVINPYLVRDLKALNLWDDVMVNDLKYYDGSVQKIDRIPDNLKALYKTAFEIDASQLVEAAARRQKWIDQSQSLNLYMPEPSGKRLNDLYTLAWRRGLKTTYYLRTLGATSTEKSTLTDGALNAVKVCSIDDEGCEACQ